MASKGPSYRSPPRPRANYIPPHAHSETEINWRKASDEWITAVRSSYSDPDLDIDGNPISGRAREYYKYGDRFAIEKTIGKADPLTVYSPVTGQLVASFDLRAARPLDRIELKRDPTAPGSPSNPWTFAYKMPEGWEEDLDYNISQRDERGEVDHQVGKSGEGLAGNFAAFSAGQKKFGGLSGLELLGGFVTVGLASSVTQGLQGIARDKLKGLIEEKASPFKDKLLKWAKGRAGINDRPAPGEPPMPRSPGDAAENQEALYTNAQDTLEAAGFQAQEADPPDAESPEDEPEDDAENT